MKNRQFLISGNIVVTLLFFCAEMGWRRIEGENYFHFSGILFVHIITVIECMWLWGIYACVSDRRLRPGPPA